MQFFHQKEIITKAKRSSHSCWQTIEDLFRYLLASMNTFLVHRTFWISGPHILTQVTQKTNSIYWHQVQQGNKSDMKKIED